MLTQIEAHRLLHDGSEKPVYEKLLKINNSEYFSIDVSQFRYFNQLKDQIGAVDLNQLVSEIPNCKPNKFFPDNYNGSDGLPLKFLLSNKNLIVISYGEFQPTRYKLFLEGVWKISQRS